MSQPWTTRTAAEIGRGIEAGSIDPLDLTEAYLDAIAAHPAGARIYARTTPERARAEAAAAGERARAGLRKGPLDGVPISWKDLFDTAGVTTEAGSKLLAGRVPERDAEVLARATLRGLVCLGKTHMSELAFSGLGFNPSTETPPCVNDPDAVPGGSSSGAATSVAFGLAAAAIGSDTGGSVRLPAAWNDLVGYKPTHGALPLDGVVPLAARFDTVGPLCRSVEDAALLFAAMSGNGKPADLDGGEAGRLRLLALTTVAQDDLRPGVAAGFEHALDALGAAGARIEHLAVPAVAEAMTLAGVLYTTEAYGTWRDTIEANPGAMFPEILERFRQGAAHSGADYVAAWQRLDRLRGAFREAVAGFDAVVLPTSPILPPSLSRLESDKAFYVAENLLALRNTRIGNLMGLAALSLPTGTPSAGLMVMVPPGQDGKLLRIGAAIERALA